jgi:hypothetical protein
MADFPLLCSSRCSSDDNTGGSNYKGAPVAGGSANTKGSWVQMAASCPHDSDALLISTQVSTGSRSCLADIGVGGSGSEVVVLSNLFLQAISAYQSGGTFLVPLQFKAGDRVSMRIQSDVASADFYFKFNFFKSGFFASLGLQSPTTYGANAGSTAGVSVTASGTTNTKGSYAQITASTTAPIRWLLPCIGDNYGTTSFDAALDIAVGAGGSEQIILPDLYVNNPSSAVTSQPMAPYCCLPVDIPAGTRIAARTKATLASAVLQLVLIGWA